MGHVDRSIKALSQPFEQPNHRRREVVRPEQQRDAVVDLEGVPAARALHLRLTELEILSAAGAAEHVVVHALGRRVEFGRLRFLLEQEAPHTERIEIRRHEGVVGDDAIAYDDLSAGNAAAVPGDRLIAGDILDRESLGRALRDWRADAVMHFAAVASVPESIALPELYWRVNVMGTKSVLDAMREVGVDKLLFSSSAATYSFDNEMPLTEESEAQPRVPYGTTKLAAERMIAEYASAYGTSYTIMRYFNASGADPDGEYGEDRSEETHLVPLVLYAAIGKRDRVQIFGDDWDTRDGTCVRDYVHTDDLAAAHQLALERLEPGVGALYNIGSGRGVTVL